MQPRRMPCNDAAHPGGRLKRRRSPPSSKGPFSSSSVSPFLLFAVSFCSPRFLLYLLDIIILVLRLFRTPLSLCFRHSPLLSSLDRSFYLSILPIFPLSFSPFLPSSHLQFRFTSTSPSTLIFSIPFCSIVASFLTFVRAGVCVYERAPYIIIQD